MHPSTETPAVPTIGARAFRAVAIAEALSWTGLLAGMGFKYLPGLLGGTGDELGVQVFGPIHGVLFVGYLVVTLAVARPLRWDTRTLVLALLASVPPLATLWFERWARRTGRLQSAPSAR